MFNKKEKEIYDTLVYIMLKFDDKLNPGDIESFKKNKIGNDVTYSLSFVKEVEIIKGYTSDWTLLIQVDGKYSEYLLMDQDYRHYKLTKLFSSKEFFELSPREEFERILEEI